jgi:hypothetical protein
MKTTKHAFRSPAALALLAVLTLALTGDRAALARHGQEEETLTLRVNSAIAAPGGLFAVVLRTYAPRPIRQGQVLVRVGRRPPAKAAGFGPLPGLKAERPVATLLSAVVYSVRGDSASHSSVTVDALGLRNLVTFQSPSAGINAADGPMAVFRFKLDPSVRPGEELDLQIDPAVTSLIDGQGQAVVIDPRAGVLTVRAPGSPFAVEAEGDEVEPGEVAELGVQTFEPFPVSGGRVTLRYAPRLAAGPPVVRMDPRYGRSTFTVSRPRAGILVVNFQSPDKSLNTVPGTIVAVSLPIKASAAIGASAPVTLDSAGTWLLSRKGRKLALKLEAGTLAIR